MFFAVRNAAHVEDLRSCDVIGTRRSFLAFVCPLIARLENEHQGTVVAFSAASEAPSPQGCRPATPRAP